MNHCLFYRCVNCNKSKFDQCVNCNNCKFDQCVNIIYCKFYQRVNKINCKFDQTSSGHKYHRKRILCTKLVPGKIVSRTEFGVSPNFLSGQLDGELLGEDVPGPLLVRVVHLVTGQEEVQVARV